MVRYCTQPDSCVHVIGGNYLRDVRHFAHVVPRHDGAPAVAGLVDVTVKVRCFGVDDEAAATGTIPGFVSVRLVTDIFVLT